MADACVIGVDLGGTKLLAGTVDAELRVHHRAYRLARRDAVLDTIVEAVQEAREATTHEIAAVGVGVPCLVEPRRGVAMACNHLPLVDVPLRDLLAERLGLPVVLDNDTNAALVAESRFGAARGAREVVMLTVGTGIGGGLLVDGRIVRGATGAAGELGHVVVDDDGPPCPGNCPNRGCLEAFVSGPALAREGRRAAEAQPDSGLGQALAAGRDVTGPLVTELAHDGDPVAREVIAGLGRWLGIGVANFVNVFNPEVVVVGGGLVAAGDLLLEPARAVVAERALVPARDQVRIVPARFGDESGMLGAAAMAFDVVRDGR
ncbi:MAG: glucokinase [Solirubrobacteraceae bacterium]|jgi:glucokinase|nr:glucokinase [Solirubrobacteraceae bacterium]MEA2288912.1 glucokinase [Solirubrobacteraceae bacterium]